MKIRTAQHLALLSACSSSCLAAALDACSLLGPDFPAPQSLSRDCLIEAAAASFESALSNGTYGEISLNTTAFSVSAFTLNDGIIYEYHHTPTGVPITTNGSATVDRDSVYRIGSISKLVTTYALLAETGFQHLHQPITDYIPELAAADESSDAYDEISNVRWGDVTLAQLASHLAGITVEPTFGDLASQGLPLEQFGFPPLNSTQAPSCGANLTTPLCTREEFFTALLGQSAVFPTSATPIYSNTAFQLLGYAMESILGRPVADVIQEDIFDRLGMSSSSYSVPESSRNGVIPGGDELRTWWSVDIGDETPAGGYYSTTADLAALGISILNSTLLTPAQTRAWLKPATHTADLRYSVGAPWEIIRVTLPGSGHVVDAYTKSGSIGAYASTLILSPDHAVGFTVLVASAGAAPPPVDAINNAFVSEMLPAAEQAAREQAESRFGGEYRADAGGNATALMRLTTDASLQGMGVELTVAGVNVFETAARELLGELGEEGQELSLRALPTGLVSRASRADGSGSYVSRMSFRLTFEVLPRPEAPGGLYGGFCLAWFSVGRMRYGGMSLDELIFGLGEDGEVRYVEYRPLALRLTREG